MCPLSDDVIKPCSVTITPIKNFSSHGAKKVYYQSLPQDCIYCGQHCPSKISLKKHVADTHQNMEIFTCYFCMKYFKSYEQKKEHSKQHHADKFKCVVCIATFCARQNLLYHLHKKHADNFVLCDYNINCGKIFKTELEKKEHISKVHENRSRSIKCIYCNKITTTFHLQHHMQVHHKSIMIKCDYIKNCPTFFFSEQERSKHYEEVHENVALNRVKCSICNKFVGRSKIHSHVKTKHKLEMRPKYVQCRYCHLMIKRQSISSHLWHFHKSEVIRCNFGYCNAYFLSQEERKEHVSKSHSASVNKGNVKQTKECIYCGHLTKEYYQHVAKNHSEVAIGCEYRKCATFFLSKEEQQKHYEEKHLNIAEMKKVICTKCNYKCLSVIDLNIHIQRIHSSDVLRCDKCQKIFKSENSLRVHIRMIHDKLWQCKVCKKFVPDVKQHAQSENCKLQSS
jgi:hypothetical protein